MPAEANRDRRRWTRGWTAFEWGQDERGYAALLDTLTHDLVDAEAADLERNATARRAQADVLEEEQRLRQDELSDARGVLDEFRRAIQDVRTRGAPDGQAEVAYDSADPEQDALADVLIQYLVRPGYAEVRTEELGESHYRYHVRVDWDRLTSLAREQGHPIPT